VIHVQAWGKRKRVHTLNHNLSLSSNTLCFSLCRRILATAVTFSVTSVMIREDMNKSKLDLFSEQQQFVTHLVHRDLPRPCHFVTLYHTYTDMSTRALPCIRDSHVGQSITGHNHRLEHSLLNDSARTFPADALAS
jgi:hypothetical protein